MKLALMTLTLVYVVETVSSMSTCKTLDLEMAKRKRIEAIRSQILSKLRLPKEPELDQAEVKEEIPTTLLSLYNSTREMLKEQQVKVQEVSTEQEEEEYFAKVLNKFNMTDGSEQVDMKTVRNVSMFFNLSEIRKSVGDSRLLTSAELRMLIKKTWVISVQRVELYHVLGSSASYIASRFVDKDSNNKWMSFDVTATLKEWLKGSEDKKGFELRLFCECEDSSSQRTFGFDISGIGKGRGDTAVLEELSKQPPYILTMSIPGNSSSHIASRSKRSTDTRDTCTAQTDSCCVRSLYIDFRKDLGWKWINKPTGYHANYCMGSCTYIWNAENKYSQILALYKHHNPGASAQPCCVPQALEPLPILYFVGRQHKVEQLSDMIVKSCKCS